MTPDELKRNAAEIAAEYGKTGRLPSVSGSKAGGIVVTSESVILGGILELRETVDGVTWRVLEP